jgi:polysaccharide export outer membrane protein
MRIVVTLDTLARIAAAFVMMLAVAGTGLVAQADPVGEPGSGYRIGPGDVLQLEVFQLDELDSRARVTEDGHVTLPLLGRVQVGGLGLSEAEELIARLLTDGGLIRDPQVSLFVEDFVSSSVSVQGAVERPGVYPLDRGKTLLEAIGDAGGVKSDRGSRILVIRPGAEGEQERMEIDLDSLIVEGDPSANIALQARDIVIVPQLAQAQVYVSGAVNKPGAVEYSSADGITVLQAVTSAGGTDPRANLRNVTIVRRGADGGQERIEVNLKAIKKGKAPDILLKPNDTVIVGEWFL